MASWPQYPDFKDAEALNSVDTQGKGEHELAEEALKRAVYITAHVNKSTTPRLAQIAKYRNPYAGNVPKKTPTLQMSFCRLWLA